MTEAPAAAKADQILIALITNQPSLFGSGDLVNLASAQQTAKNIAAFRQQLIEELKKQG